MRLALIIFFFLVSVACHAQYDKHDKIVLINTGNADRKGIAAVLDRINEIGKPKVIAIDYQFSTNKDSATDNTLIRALTGCGRLVLISVIDQYFERKVMYDRFIPGALEKFKTNATTGFGNVILEEDEVLRNFPVWEYVDGELERRFALETVFQYDSLQVKKFERFHSNTWPVDFKKGFGFFVKYDLSDVLSGKVASKDIDGKIVMVGSLEPGNEDKFFSPLTNRLIKEPDMYCLEYLATVVSQILEYK